MNRQFERDDESAVGGVGGVHVEHVRELGAASSNLVWLACVDCSYVWMPRRPALRTDVARNLDDAGARSRAVSCSCCC
jgi:hypothetical protein